MMVEDGLPLERAMRRASRAVAKSSTAFNEIIREVRERLVPSAALLFHRKIALTALSGIVEKTPVDTGRARGNWNLTIGTPEYLSSPEAGAARTPEVVSRDALAKLTVLSLGAVVWISNGLDYISLLEDGRSSQAPAGMVALTLDSIGETYRGGAR